MKRQRLIAGVAGAHRAIALLGALSVLSVGCTSTAPIAAPLPAPMSIAEARAEFGTLGVAAVGRTPELHVERFETSRWKAAGEGALAGLVFPLALEKSGTSLIVAIGLAPLTMPIGAIYGALAAQSQDEVEPAVSTVEAATRDANVQQRLRDLVIAHLNREHYGGVVPVDETATASADIETVVHVGVNDMFLTAALDEFNQFNPALTLSLDGEMRLLKNGIEVKRLPLSTPLRFPGAARKLRAWAADDAQSFKEGIADQLEKLAGDVVSKLLLRPIPQPSANELLP